MHRIERVCVYCGSGMGADPRYRAAAQELGEALADAGIGLVFGGGRVGLMGVTADAVMARGGQATGIIPQTLRSKELAHAGLTELVVVDSMHERKRRMAELSDAFAVLPGGIGTLDEMFEIVTWRQLKLHDKPIYLIDIADYWRPLTDLLDHIAAQNFVTPVVPRLVEVVPDIPALMTALRSAGVHGGVGAALGATRSVNTLRRLENP